MNINYQRMLDESMLDLVRKVLIKVEEEGVFGEHHFYISFRSDHPGVILSERMKQRYPQEITIVLQNQFEDLITRQDYFSVKLSFNGIKEVIRVPFEALTNFVDPSVKFSLQFTPNSLKHEVVQKENKSKEVSKSSEEVGNVIALDKFRSKNKLN